MHALIADMYGRDPPFKIYIPREMVNLSSKINKYTKKTTSDLENYGSAGRGLQPYFKSQIPVLILSAIKTKKIFFPCSDLHHANIKCIVNLCCKSLHSCFCYNSPDIDTCESDLQPTRRDAGACNTKKGMNY